MTASYTCSQCSTTETVVWRSDRETSVVLCNSCYIKKYPRSLNKCTEENGNSAKRQKTEADSIDGKIVKSSKDEKKEELKEEWKEEIKEETEVKEEINEDEENSNLEAMFADVEESKPKKRKHHGDRVMEQDNGAFPEVDMPQSDTEYDKVDLDLAPPIIVVEASGNSKIDGKYDRMPEASRGRPCYYMRKKERVVFLYWATQWHIGGDIGNSTKSFVRVNSVAGLSDCCEPYPHAWEVLDMDSARIAKTWVIMPALRVIDGRCAQDQPQLPDPLQEDPEFFKNGETGEVAEVDRKKSKRERKAEKAEKAAETAAEKAEKSDQAKDGDGAKKEAKEAEAKTEKAEAPDNESDSSQSSSSQSSDSSDEASGQGGDGANQISQEEIAKKEAKKAEEIAKKAKMFEENLRGEIKKYPDLKGRLKKISTIKDMLHKRASHLEQALGYTQQSIAELVQSFQRDYGVDSPSAKSPRQPNAPPPDHLRNQGDARGPAMPTTPPENAGENSGTSDLAHRNLKPGRGVLKRRGTITRKNDEHLSTLKSQPPFEEVNIRAWRYAGEDLWYQAPGSVVVCDKCERGVAQSMGALQGAPGQSQFAQCEFLCSDCMANNP